MKTRIEKDSMGEVIVPEDALYGAQTQRAIDNFKISGQKLPEPFIKALLKVKLAAAKANSHLKLIDSEFCDAITTAIQTILEDEKIMDQFPVDIYQTGSGTSTNMNANEVIANLATKQSNLDISPNDHVNFGQSSNDVIPTSIHVSALIEIKEKLLPSLKHLSQTIEDKAESVQQYVKTGRTHLMDAMPVTLKQSLLSWHEQVILSIKNIEDILPNLSVLAQGGTAVGSGINTHEDFAEIFAIKLSEDTSTEFKPARNFFSLIGTQDTIVSLSGQLKTLAVSLMKISNDLRWMNSGPLSGLGEIELEALQPGSSIMPGKVNPVIPEALTMISAEVIGNDSSITIGGLSGNFELNVMLPMIANNILTSIKLLSNGSLLLADKAISTFKVNENNLVDSLSRNPILITALNPRIGYLKAAEIAKKAYKQQRPIVDVAEEETDISREELLELLDPSKLTSGGL